MEDDIGSKLLEKGNLGAKVGSKRGVCNTVNDDNSDEGAENGVCPFVVHGLIGSNLEHLGKIRLQEIRARAVEYFKSGEKALGIGQENEPKSLYNNPQLYLQMFPWLFLYGLGGLKNHMGSISVFEEK